MNALCHRDYSEAGASVGVAIFDDRLEVWSCGRLPGGLTTQQLLGDHPSVRRNELIADVFEVLDALLENLGFLGRAESWVDARRAPAPVDFNCVPDTECVDLETGEVTSEIVRLMAPHTPETYRASRSEKLAAAGIELGPIALGFACHFGLGLFAPASDA